MHNNNNNKNKMMDDKTSKETTMPNISTAAIYTVQIHSILYSTRKRKKERDSQKSGEVKKCIYNNIIHAHNIHIKCIMIVVASH